ncbi:MAG TPA: class I SAM-dependent methyltransferase, partial [Dehalococcoidales bacterium]|nr:class I SAM-dependent methyltransferase [Dehalococcoidales bacterium]
GDTPSRTAVYALELFRTAGVKTVLVPGSGYGRNTKHFSTSVMQVTGVEISTTAYKTALVFDPDSNFYNASALDLGFIKEKFDAVYCFNVLHLFRENERKLFLKQCAARLKAHGLMFFTVFSEKEGSFGKGAQTEPNTFESKPGRPVHYFTENDLKGHFGGMKIIESGILEDPENHGAEGPHTHRLRYIYAKI